MLPDRLFPDVERLCIITRLPISSGSEPVNRLLEISSVAKFNAYLMEGGMFPLCVLLCAVKICVLGAPRRPFEIGPESSLFSNRTRVRLLQFSYASGIVPQNILFQKMS